MKKINKNTCHYPAGLDNPEKVNGFDLLDSRIKYGNDKYKQARVQYRVGQSKKGFTLVELIIVITILAILATIAFVSFQNYTKDARDGNRVSTITNIQKGLELYTIKTGKYPNPEDIYASGHINNDVLFEVGYVKEGISRMINFSKTPIDPVGENNYYVYGVSYDNNQYQIATTLENLQTSIIVPTTYANSLQAHVSGNYKGIIKKGDIYSNPESLILPTSYSWGTNLAQNIHFVTDKGQNLPYKINQTTTLTGGTTKTTTGITITKTNWNTLSGSIQTTLGVSPDIVGVMVFGEKEYFSSVKDGGSTETTQEDTPSASTFPTTCGSGQTITYEQAQANKATILANQNINNYIGCNITGIGQIAGYTYSGTTVAPENKMVLVVETTDTAGANTTKWGDTITDIDGAGNNITANTNTTTMTGSIYARDGLKNTNDIIASQGAGTIYAAQKCNAKGTGRYLPATEELNQLYCYNNNDATNDGTYYGVGANHADCVNKGYIANNKMTLLNFSATNYWSSTELSTSYSRYQHFGTGRRYSFDIKTGSFAVRCVSRF